MELKSRLTKGFIEIKVDEIETTLFDGDNDNIMTLIENLESIVTDLEKYLNPVNNN